LRCIYFLYVYFLGSYDDFKKSLDEAKKEIDWLGKKGYTAVFLGDQRYPDLLREIFNPPLVLYCAGKVETLNDPSVSLVGTRRPSPYGRAVAEKLAWDLASSGLTVVSGLARGIDSIAHQGAVKGGKTTAVLGSGLNNIYPKEHRKLYEKTMSWRKGTADEQLLARACGLVFLVNKLGGSNNEIGIRATVDTLADLMVVDLAQSSSWLRGKLPTLLDRCPLLMKVGDEYRIILQHKTSSYRTN